MRKILCACVLVLSAAGCATVSGVPASTTVQGGPVKVDPFSEIAIGMAQAEVVALLNGEVTVGYEADPASGQFKPIRRKTLVSSEIIEDHGQDYQVDMYLPRGGQDASSGMAQAAVKPYPFIYSKGALVAKGFAELEALRVRAAAGHAQ